MAAFDGDGAQHIPDCGQLSGRLESGTVLHYRPKAFGSQGGDVAEACQSAVGFIVRQRVRLQRQSLPCNPSLRLRRRSS